MLEKTFTRIFIVLTLIISVVIPIYFQSLNGEFLHWDDREYVLYNVHVHSITIDNLLWMFTQYHQNNWHPLTWLSHSIDYLIWGNNSWGHHLSNVIFHILNAMLVFSIFQKILMRSLITENEWYKPSQNNRIFIASALCALIFAVHPLNVESVVWISERKNLLYAFFFLLAIYMHLLYINTENYIYKVGTFIAFLCSALSKSMAISLPMVLILLDYYPYNRFSNIPFRTRLVIFIREKIIYFLVVLSLVIVTIYTQSISGAIRTLDEVPLITRVLNSANSTLLYIKQIFIPYDLSPFYPYPDYITSHTLLSWLPLILCMLLLIFCLYYANKKSSSSPLIVYLYYVITVSPVIGIIQVGQQAHADRYTYLTTLSILLLVAGFLVKYSQNKREISRIILIFTVFYIGVMAFSAHQQSLYWKTDADLWERVVMLYPGKSALAEMNMGNVRYTNGKYKDAEQHYLNALELNPDNINAKINLNLVYEKTGRSYLARKVWENLINSDRSNPWLWLEYGDFLLRQGMDDLAKRAYKQSIIESGSSIEIKKELEKRGVISKAIE